MLEILGCELSRTSTSVRFTLAFVAGIWYRVGNTDLVWYAILCVMAIPIDGGHDTIPLSIVFEINEV